MQLRYFIHFTIIGSKCLPFKLEISLIHKTSSSVLYLNTKLGSVRLRSDCMEIGTTMYQKGDY